MVSSAAARSRRFRWRRHGSFHFRSRCTSVVPPAWVASRLELASQIGGYAVLTGRRGGHCLGEGGGHRLPQRGALVLGLTLSGALLAFSLRAALARFPGIASSLGVLAGVLVTSHDHGERTGHARPPLVHRSSPSALDRIKQFRFVETIAEAAADHATSAVRVGGGEV
jgi:hypothetical protein